MRNVLRTLVVLLFVITGASICGAQVFTQNFDGVTAPTLPAGWSATGSGSGTPWVTSTTSPDTAPNCAFTNDPNTISDQYLDTPTISLPSNTNTLTFRNFYNTEAGFDGGVLEIKIGAASFVDILTAGGTFTANGYNSTISVNFSSPIMGRQAWSGNSGAYLTTTCTLPASSQGQNCQFRFRMATDTSVAATGWFIDGITITTAGPTPTITVTSAANPLNLGSTSQGVAGTPASYTVSGANLTANILIQAPSTSVEVSTNSTSGFGASVTLTQSGGSVATTTIFARISAAAPQGAVSGNITHTSAGATQQNLAVTGTVTAPTPSINVTSATNPLDLGTAITGTAGTPASYTVTGANLTTDITVTAPANVEISQTGAAGTYAGAQTLTHTGGSVNATIHARITSTAPVGSITGNITHASSGATTQNLAVTGNVTVPPPTINIGGVTPPLNLGTTFQGTAGTPASYTVTGSNLTANILVTAPANVELSQTGAAGTYAASQTLTQTGGSVNATIHARIAATASIGSVTGNISHTSSGATTQNLAVTGTVNPTAPDMTVARGATSVADGGTDALGNRAFGVAASLTYTIGNPGTAALSLTGVPPVVATAGTNCSVTVTAQPSPTSVPISGTVTFTVEVTPTAAGAFNATISIANNDPAAGKNPYNWTLDGTGVAAPNMTLSRGAAIADGGSDAIGNVSTTVPLTLTYTVGNSGNAVLNLNGTPRVAVSGATNCVVSVTTQPAATVAVATTTTFVISVRATASGALSFVVSIANDDPNQNPYNFTVNGTGAGGVGGGGAGGGGGGGGGCQTGDVPSHAWLLLLAAIAAVVVSVRRARA